jgi:hypothetical protein
MKVSKQIEERCIPIKDISEWAFYVNVVTPNALQGQIESISDSYCAATSLVDSPLSVDLILRKDHHSAYGVTDSVEGLQFLNRDQCLNPLVPFERWDHCIAGERKFTRNFQWLIWIERIF